MAAERLVLTANPLSSFWACSRQAASPETGSQTPRRQQGDAQSLDLSRSYEWNFHQLPAQRNCRNFSSSENFLRLIPFKKKPKILSVHCVPAHLTPLMFFFLLFFSCPHGTSRSSHIHGHKCLCSCELESLLPGIHSSLRRSSWAQGEFVSTVRNSPSSFKEQITSLKGTWWRYVG